MAKVKILSSFRVNGKAYPASEKTVEVDGEALKIGLKTGMIEDPEGNAKYEAEANKNKGNAPENK